MAKCQNAQGFSCPVHLLLLIFGCLFAAVAACAPAAFIVELDESGRFEIDQQFAHTLRRMLGERFVIHRSASAPFAGPGTPLIRITLGETALHEAQESALPILALFVTDTAFARLHQSPTKQTAIFYNPPLLRQARLARLVLPRGNRIAILEAQSNTRLPYWKTALETDGFSVQIFLVDNTQDLVSVLGRALSWGDYLLGTADPNLYNGSTLKHILLTAYRRNKTLIGPNQAYVNAGALASTYTTLDQYALTASEVVEAYAAGEALPEPAFPLRFNVLINDQVARSLNIPVPDSTLLERDLRALEKADAP